MVSVKYIATSGSMIQKWSASIVQGSQQVIAAAMEETLAGGDRDMVQMTASRPSAKSGKAGRIETGAMIGAIDHRIIEATADKVVGEFGFLDEQQLYYALQTTLGFTHNRSGAFIEPTNALRDAFLIAEAYIVHQVQQGMKNL